MFFLFPISIYMFNPNKATKAPQAIQKGVVNVPGKQASVQVGDQMMSALLHYFNVKWGVVKLESGTIFDLPGYLIHSYVKDAAILIRGLHNNHSITLESYESDPSFLKFKNEYLKEGRLPALDETDFTKSNLVNMMLCLTGVTVNFVLALRKHNIKANVHHIMGTSWINHFRTFYCLYSEKNDHYELDTSKLPLFCRMPANMGRTIFRTTCLHRDVLIRENCSFTIPQQK